MYLMQVPVRPDLRPGVGGRMGQVNQSMERSVSARNVSPKRGRGDFSRPK